MEEQLNSIINQTYKNLEIIISDDCSTDNTDEIVSKYDDDRIIYLKNKNARKALEELLRLLRSKGVIIVMLSQGVEDYKTKDYYPNH